MGCCISIPLSCCLQQTGNLCSTTLRSSVATRIVYALIFLTNSLLSWCSLSNSLTGYLEHLSWGLFKVGNKYCREHGCIGFTNVQRLNFCLGALHLSLAFLLVGVRSTSNPRASIQNGWWGTKITSLWILIFLSYLFPDKFFVIWGNYFSIIFSTVFIGIGLILLVDFAHEWAETCMEKIEEGEIYLDDDLQEGCLEGTNFWRTILVGGTLSMYVAVIIMTILMYTYFAQSGCTMNTTVITINFLLVIIITIISISPIVQDYNPNAGIAQSSMCCIYCTYLVFSACLSEPDDKMCNPLIRSGGTRNATVIMGAIMTFAAVAYTTTRAAANSAFSHNNKISDNIYYDEITLNSQPKKRSQMRYEALRQAVNEGSLPESALNDVSYFEDLDNLNDEEGEEKHYTKYNYVLFHIIFFLATQYIAALLTINVASEAGEGGFVPVGRTYFNTWLKIVSSWVCYLLYSWTILAPVAFPDRFN